MAGSTGSDKMKIAVLGAGAIGCYVGGRLKAAGCNVTLIGRERVGAVLGQHGLKLTDFAREAVRVAPQNIRFETEASVLAGHDCVLVTTKSMGTEEAAREIAKHADRNATVISLQNGLSNREVLARACAPRTVLGGMVVFNVASRGNGEYACATDGDLVIETDAAADRLVRWLRTAGVTARTTRNIEAVQWGKLCLNLNNALNVLSGVPLREQLRDRDHRRVIALAIDELLAVARAKGIKPAKIGKAPPKLIPFILRLPTPLFERVAASLIRIDPTARTSMWDDLQAGRTPEIDYLNGAVIMEGLKAGVPTPVNQRVSELVKQAFEHGESQAFSGSQLLAMVVEPKS